MKNTIDRATKRNEKEITPEMIEKGLVWLIAFDREYSDGRREVMEILRLALPNRD